MATESLNKVVRVNQTQFFKVCTWLANNQEKLIKNAPLKTELARTIMEELKIQISPGTVKKAIEACGVQYNPRFLSGNAAKGKLKVRIVEMDNQIQTLQNEVAELKKGHQEQLNKLQADCSCFFAVVRNIAKELNYKIEGDPVNPKQIKIVV